MKRWLASGDELVSYVEGIGELRERLVAAPDSGAWVAERFWLRGGG